MSSIDDAGHLSLSINVSDEEWSSLFLPVETVSVMSFSLSYSSLCLLLVGPSLTSGSKPFDAFNEVYLGSHE